MNRMNLQIYPNKIFLCVLLLTYLQIIQYYAICVLLFCTFVLFSDLLNIFYGTYVKLDTTIYEKNISFV